jgi:hypothetical protein
MIDAAPAPDTVPETDRHAGAEHGRDKMPLLVYEEAAGKEVMAVLIWIIKHGRISWGAAIARALRRNHG